MTDVKPTATLDEVEMLGDDSHIACCDDDDIALCGIDVKDEPWIPAGTAITCAGCVENDEREVCPRGGFCGDNVEESA